AATGSASRHRAPRKDAFAKSPAPERRQPRRSCATAGYPTAVALFETEGIRHRLTRRESRQCVPCDLKKGPAAACAGLSAMRTRIVPRMDIAGIFGLWRC